MGFEIEEVPGKEVSITEQNESVLTYCYDTREPYSYVHPLYAPNGEIITDEYANKYPPGLCFSFGAVYDTIDRQVQLKRNNTTLEYEISDSDISGECVELIDNTTWKGSNIEIVERFRTAVHSSSNNVRVIDITIEIHSDTHPITFKENIGLGYAAVEMEHRKSANANGQIGELEVHQKSSNWATLCGISSNTAVGLAILPHPDNGKTIFQAEDAYQGYLLAQISQFTLDVDTTQTLKYRIVIYVGDLFTIDLSEYYDNYIS